MFLEASAPGKVGGLSSAIHSAPPAAEAISQGQTGELGLISAELPD
jgi:hypothetical protein